MNTSLHFTYIFEKREIQIAYFLKINQRNVNLIVQNLKIIVCILSEQNRISTV